MRLSMSNKLHIYKASAGAGKTYTLAKEYIRLALMRPHNYRHIQAVTFTNKATEEMKQRIINNLKTISEGGDPQLTKTLCMELGISPTELQARARRCLRSMLLDYGSFRVSTIDSFFQEVLRSFARELDLKGHFRVETENKYILEEAINALLIDERDKEASPILTSIRELSLDRMNRGKTYDPIAAMGTLASEIMRDEVRAMQLPSREEVQSLRQSLEGRQREAVVACKSIADRVAPLCEVGRLNRKSQSPLCVFKNWENLPEGELPEKYEPMPSFYTKLRDPETIFAKNAQPDEATLTIVVEGMRDYIAQLRILRDVQTILPNLPALALLSALSEKVREVQSSKRCILLSDAPSLINRLLADEGGVPFLYERIGTNLGHVMIDEFQDTSKTQFDNFVPLFEHALSLSEGQDSLIVGDVKQSIYRFRGSDSKQLIELARKDSKDEPFLPKKVHNLDTNWRSSKAVVHFNNQLYSLLPQMLRDSFTKLYQACGIRPDSADGPSLFTSVYEGAGQKENKQHAGRVVLHRYRYSDDIGEGEEGDMYLDAEPTPEAEIQKPYETIAEQLPEQIRHLRKRGYKSGDILILVRSKAEANFIVKILGEASRASEGETFEVVSADALSPVEAISVSFVVFALSYVARQDELSLYKLRELWCQMTEVELSEDDIIFLQNLGRRSLYESLEVIIARFRDHFVEGEWAHLIKLLDTALNYQMDLSIDIMDFLDMWQERADSLRLLVPEDERKIKLMTIHKAKGLESPVVLLPYLYWQMTPSNGAGWGTAEYLWCENPFDAGAGYRLPINLNKSLLDTSFAGNYLQECIYSSLDGLNLLYVATTRAKDELHFWLPDRDEDHRKIKTKREELKPSKTSTKDSTEEGSTIYPPKTVLGLWEQCLSAVSPTELGYEELLLGEVDACEEQVAERETKHSIDEPSRSIGVGSMLASYDLSERIEELREGAKHFDKERQRNFGNVMHHILSRLTTLDDLDRVREELIQQGDLRPEEKEDAEARLSLLLGEPSVREWFDGSGRVLNERSIMTPDGSSKRPDRIIVYPDGRVVIVDYKFGKERESYKWQVRNYGKLLRGMGYKRVEGYLWYINGIAEGEGETARAVPKPERVYYADSSSPDA